jgi:hypothetical protein
MPIAMIPFSNLTSITCDNSNNVLYVADVGNQYIRAITSDGVVKTITQTGLIHFQSGFTYGDYCSLIVDSSNNIYYTTGTQYKKLTILSSYDVPFLAPVVNNIGSIPQISGQTFSESLEFTPPAQPTFTITSVTNTSFLLTVTSVGSDYATSYTYSLNGGVEVSLSPPVTVTPTIGSYNTIIVYGKNINGQMSNTSSVQLLPGNFTVSYTISLNSQINLSWTWSNGSARYNYSWSDTRNGSGSDSINYSSTSVTLSPNPDSTFTFNINSQNSAIDGTLQYTNTLPVTFAVPSPQVTNFFLSAWTSSTITVNWTASTNATSYTRTIADSTAPSTLIASYGSTIGTVTGTFCNFNSITPFTKSYIISITANNTTGTTVAAATYTISAPTTPVIQNIVKSGSSYIITWNGGELTSTTTTGIVYYLSSTSPSTGFTSFTPSSTSSRTAAYNKTANVASTTIFTGSITTLYIKIGATYSTTTKYSNVFTLNKQ